MAEQVSRGLEGVVIGETRTSLVDGIAGKLSYGGYCIEDLAAHATFEEVVFLLWHNRLPVAAELEALRLEIAQNAALPLPMLALLRAFPPDADPMAVLEASVAALAFHDEDAADNSLEAAQRKALRLTSQITTLCAAWNRIRSGATPVAPRRELTLAQNFLYMLRDELPDETAAAALDVYLVLLAEHGMNASTFTARVVTATESDIHSAVVAAIGALKGPAHGGANSAAMRMFLEIGEPCRVADWFREEVQGKRRRIMGIGHRVYKAPDPRASVLKQHSRALATSSGNGKWFDIAEQLEQAARADDYFIERRLFPNVDYYSAILLYTFELDVDMFTPLFVMSRIAGWSAHIFEQKRNNRLIRPKASYVGPQDREWEPLAGREAE